LGGWSGGVAVAELSCLARTVSAWEVEILAFHSTGSCSNAPIQAGNLLTGKVKPLGTASQLRQLPPRLLLP
jgi:hypothetical protein